MRRESRVDAVEPAFGEVGMASPDLDSAIEQSHLALSEIVRGNAEPYQVLLSHRGDVTLGNPFGPFVRGWRQCAQTAADAASRYRDGEIVGFDPIARHVSHDLACIVEIERFRAKVGANNDFATVALRVTSMYRPEDGSWKLVHRHADPITTPQASESVIPK
jgi:ketosteroid isomerase-like protein